MQCFILSGAECACPKCSEASERAAFATGIVRETRTVVGGVETVKVERSGTPKRPKSKSTRMDPAEKRRRAVERSAARVGGRLADTLLSKRITLTEYRAIERAKRAEAEAREAEGRVAPHQLDIGWQRRAYAIARAERGNGECPALARQREVWRSIYGGSVARDLARNVRRGFTLAVVTGSGGVRPFDDKRDAMVYASETSGRIVSLRSETSGAARNIGIDPFVPVDFAEMFSDGSGDGAHGFSVADHPDRTYAAYAEKADRLAEARADAEADRWLRSRFGI